MLSLEAIKAEAKKLVKLLEDPQPGLSSWHGFLQERVRVLHELTGLLLEDLEKVK